MLKTMTRCCLVACLVATPLLITGCGGSSEPTVLDRPDEDFVESLRASQAEYAASMKENAKGN